MKKFFVFLLVLFLVSCPGHVMPDSTHKFRAIFTNDMSQEVTYKYLVTTSKSDGVEGLMGGGTLLSKESIGLSDMAYAKLALGRVSALDLLVGNGGVYRLVFWTDSSSMPKERVLILTDEMLGFADEMFLQNEKYYRFGEGYGFEPSDKDRSFFD